MKRDSSHNRETSVSTPADPEINNSGKIKVRAATSEDIKRLVEIDLECFDDSYGDEPPPFEEIHEMLESRRNVIGDLMVVGELDGTIEGFMTCQVTDTHINDYTSWEETTDNGYLTTTHNPEGRYFYVVNMTVTEKGSAVNLSDFLIANLYSSFVEQRKESVLLLSRIPDFRQWLAENNIIFEDLEPSEQDKVADEYMRATTVVEGREVAYDRILRRMVREGSKPVKAIREGFQDPPSHNYGVLCTYEGPIPRSIRHNRITSKIAGKALRFASQHPAILKKFL